MKYIKKFEAKEKIRLSIDISLFPNHTGLEENEEPTTGTWTTFWSDSHIKEIGQKYSNIIWRKYYGKNDPYEKSKSKFVVGPTRPEFETYPKELADLLIYIGEFSSKSESYDIDVILKILKKKKYWNYSNVDAPIDNNDEIEFEIFFDSKKDALDWLDMFEFVLNDPDSKERIEVYMTSKKYNL